MGQQARRKASAGAERPYVFETNEMFVDAGIEGDEFLIAETKDRDVEKKSIVSLMDCVEDSKKNILCLARTLNKAHCDLGLRQVFC